MSKIKIGENRLIPKGTRFWSIKKQTNMLLDEDVIMEVKHTCTVQVMMWFLLNQDS